MEKLIVNSYDEFASHLGQVLGTSDWVEVTQERINLFADATMDHQWIHVDTERAKVESPYKSTIAHGYLTLSLLPHMWNQIIEVNNLKMMVNYGMDKMKFGQAVVTGSSVRLVTTLQSIANLRGVCKAEIKFKIEIKDARKPALEGIATFLNYFEETLLTTSFAGKSRRQRHASPCKGLYDTRHTNTTKSYEENHRRHLRHHSTAMRIRLQQESAVYKRQCEPA